MRQDHTAQRILERLNEVKHGPEDEALTPYEEFEVDEKTYYFTPGGFLYRRDPGTEEVGGFFCGYLSREAWRYRTDDGQLELLLANHREGVLFEASSLFMAQFQSKVARKRQRIRIMRESSKPGRLSSYGRARYQVINCGQGTDTASIAVVYNGTTITAADKVSDCETVKNQNGQVVDQTQLPQQDKLRRRRDRGVAAPTSSCAPQRPPGFRESLSSRHLGEQRQQKHPSSRR